MRKLNESGLRDALEETVIEKSSDPRNLFGNANDDRGSEGDSQELGWIKGECKRFEGFVSAKSSPCWLESRVLCERQ